MSQIQLSSVRGYNWQGNGGEYFTVKKLKFDHNTVQSDGTAAEGNEFKVSVQEDERIVGVACRNYLGKQDHF